MDRRQFIARLGGACALTTLGRARPAVACVWDTDTLAQEARGVPGVVETLVGGFARNPDAYYEMRLARVRVELERNPDLLDHYDDAAVACDRLGRHDEAIAWMAQKLASLERLDVSRDPTRRGSTPTQTAPDHWYRTHANLGTFHAHRWLHRPERWDALDDLQRGHDLIAQAIVDNPDAHFGREIYQLRVLAWLLTRPSWVPERVPSSPFSDDAPFPSFVDAAALTPSEQDDAVRGLCGLITLGAAWNSFDITLALARILLRQDKPGLVRVARDRCDEIIADGGRSLVLGAPTDESLSDYVPRIRSSVRGQFPESHFDRLRPIAKAWTTKREAYMLERLGRGEHPDTHAEFWAEFAGDPDRLDLASLGIGPGLAPRVEPERASSGCGCELGAGGTERAAVHGLVGGAFVLALARRRRMNTSNE